MENSYQYFKRDLSWLSFNYRVLLEAEDDTLPIYERIKFLSIYSSNLEEFYEIRVAEHRGVIMKKNYSEESAAEAEETLAAITREVNRQQRDYYRIFSEKILPELNRQNVYLYQNEKPEPFHEEFVHNFFNEEVFPFLSPVMIQAGDIRTFIRDRRLYLVIRMIKRSKRMNEPGFVPEYHYALMKIPYAKVPRFIELPPHDGKYYIMFIDDIIRANLQNVFPGYIIDGCYSIKISRDADIYLDDESRANIVENIRKKVKKRKIGALSRFMYDQAMPGDFLAFVCDAFGITSEDLVLGGRYNNLQDLMKLPNPAGKHLEQQPPVPMRVPFLDEMGSVFKAVKKRDILLHFPYESFDYLIRFLMEAAFDPKVDEIKITQYRVAENSAVINTLVSAAQNGKKVTVFVELKARFDEVMNQTIYAYISDGGIQEEISQGSGRIAGALGLDNLIMFYDSNDIQLSTETKDVTVEDTAMKYEAWGWNVLSINGNDPDEIRAAIKEAQAEKERPTLIIGKTVMGKGARKADGSSYEANCATHGAPLGGDAYVNTIKNLGGDPTNPFVIFPEVAELYAKRAEELKKIVAEKYAKKAAWAKANPELAAKLELFFSGKAPKVDWAAIEQKAGSATRAASATVLGGLATQVENMIVASADLSNSDKTDGFLKKTHSFKKGDFSGAFFQAGVSELSMACICIGMSLHGGVIAACGTFFVFSDYMKPAVRMAALMEQPVKFIWTHDAFRVGEDGPTHEPVEQEAQIRLMEKLKNHKGHNSMLVLRPADAEETTIAWKLAMENMSTPTGLIFSRQNIANLPAGTDYEQAAKGAYIVAGSDENPDVILVASGSEVSTLVAGTELLRKDGVKVRIVSAPSEGLFRNQPKEYQEAILPADAKIFGMTAGLPVTLQGLVGCHGKVWGLESFGFSAPYKVLDEKLGFTAENVYNQVKAML